MLEVPPVKTPKQSPKMSPKKVHPKKDNEQGGSPKLSPPSGSPKNASPKPSPKKLKAAKDPSPGPSPKLPAKKILGSKNINAENLPLVGQDVNRGGEPAPVAVPNSSPSRPRRSGLGEVRRSSTFDEIKEDAELVLTNDTVVNGGKAKEKQVVDSPDEPHLGLLDEIREETDENDSLPPGSYS